MHSFLLKHGLDAFLRDLETAISNDSNPIDPAALRRSPPQDVFESIVLFLPSDKFYVDRRTVIGRVSKVCKIWSIGIKALLLSPRNDYGRPRSERLFAALVGLAELTPDWHASFNLLGKAANRRSLGSHRTRHLAGMQLLDIEACIASLGQKSAEPAHVSDPDHPEQQDSLSPSPVPYRGTSSKLEKEGAPDHEALGNQPVAYNNSLDLMPDTEVARGVHHETSRHHQDPEKSGQQDDQEDGPEDTQQESHRTDRSVAFPDI